MDNSDYVKMKSLPWLVWLSQWEHHLINQRVAGSIPSQGTYLGFRSSPQSGCVREATNRCFSLSLSLSPSLLSLLPKINEHVLG